MMKLFRGFLVACAGLLLLIGLTPSAHGWCTPRVVNCLTVIDSSNAEGHDDVNRYNCTGSTQFNGKAHVYRLDHLGGPLWIDLEWAVRDDPDRCHALGLFVLGSCDRNDCLAYDPHYVYMDAPAGDYWIIVDGRDDTAIEYTLIIHCGDNPLPVELTSFDAVSEGSGVRLRWTVASELNNDGFEIQRSNAGSENWAFIGYVHGRGTASTSATYNFVDMDVVASMSYTYRLVSVGAGGERETLGLVSATYTAADISVASDFRFLGNYPNPFNPSTLLRFEIAEPSEIAIDVYDVHGRLVSRLLSGAVTAGVHEVSFNAEGLPSGLYLAQLRAGSHSDLLKMILMK